MHLFLSHQGWCVLADTTQLRHPTALCTTLSFMPLLSQWNNSQVSELRTRLTWEYLWVLTSDQDSFAALSIWENWFSSQVLFCFALWITDRQSARLGYVVCISSFSGVVSRTDFDHSSHHFLIQVLLHNMSNCSIRSLSPAVAVLFFYVNPFSEFSLLLIWGFHFQIIKDLLFYFWFIPGQYLTYFSATFFFPPSEHKATFARLCRAQSGIFFLTILS